jgi:hypothetical protein
MCAGLARFLVDLVEPAKCYVVANSIDGVAGQDNPHGQYNELDLSKAMNRHAAICQFQRLIKSVIFTLKQMSTTVNVEELEDIGMTDATTLRSDVDSGTVIAASPPEKKTEKKAGKEAEKEAKKKAEKEAKKEAEEAAGESADKPPNEKWLFVNGMAGELCWLRLACERLAQHFSREVTGVFKRGYGILWDLIECAGERTAQGKGIATKQKRSIKRTKSSSLGQESLKKELIEALKTTKKHVVMIAHSQGCLLLRLVLEDILNDLVTPGILAIRKAMLDRLCVFTFGNPSVDWKWEKNIDQKENIGHEENIDQEVKDPKQLSSFVLRTDHFANEADFVTKLGVLSVKMLENRGYAPERLFINKKEDWIGHLFGTQYSLDSNDYTGTEGELNGQTSWLLACRNGRSMEDVSKVSSCVQFINIFEIGLTFPSRRGGSEVAHDRPFRKNCIF